MTRTSRYPSATSKPETIPVGVAGQLPLLESGDQQCRFCFPAAIAPTQLLAATEHFYLLALAGQIVEGFLGIMTHRCGDHPARLRCLDDIPGQWVSELDALRDMILSFYVDAYGSGALLYEHGRGGGQLSYATQEGFALHPHLCAIPGDFEVHPALQERFEFRRAPRFTSIRAEIGQRPYLYVHTPGDQRSQDAVVYYCLDSGDRVSTLSLKKVLVEIHSIDGEPNWRQYPGERELVDLVAKFNHWYAAKFRRMADPWLSAVSSP